MSIQGGECQVSIFGMDQFGEIVQIRRVGVVLSVAQNLVPARRQIGCPGFEVAFPDSVLGCFDCECESIDELALLIVVRMRRRTAPGA
jgi:hypothetical protein